MKQDNILKTSIVMACYNGEKYIEKQLNSLYSQTLLPDEVLIFDDQSTDDTVRIVQDFIKKNDLQDRWFCTINPNRLGCSKNFILGALKSSGDIIFFCDQDDIWDSRKVHEMVQGFENYEDMLACYCLSELIDDDDKIIKSKSSFMCNVRTHGLKYKKVPLAENIKYNNSPGLCLAFRRSILNDISRTVLECDLMHDLPVGNIASIKDGYYVVNDKLVYYRQHQNNLSKPRISIKSRVQDMENQIIGRESRLLQYLAIDKCFGESIRGRDRRDFNKCIEYTSNSIEFLKTKNLCGVVKQLFIPCKMINKWIAVNNVLCVLYWYIRKK